MKATIYSHEVQIGTVELKPGDLSMGHLYGEFIPNDIYYASIQKRLWNLSSNNWNSLRLNVQLENEHFLFGVGGITLTDSEELPDEAKQIDIAGITSYTLEYLFGNLSSTIIKEPWETISIGQKLAFEDELSKELGNHMKKRSIIDFFQNSSSDKHSLYNATLSALFTDSRNDDVLFGLSQENNANQFALVHLTWRGSKELQGWPKVTYYENFEQFRILNMDDDAEEYYE